MAGTGITMVFDLTGKRACKPQGEGRARMFVSADVYLSQLPPSATAIGGPCDLRHTGLSTPQDHSAQPCNSSTNATRRIVLPPCGRMTSRQLLPPSWLRNSIDRSGPAGAAT